MPRDLNKAMKNIDKFSILKMSFLDKLRAKTGRVLPESDESDIVVSRIEWETGLANVRLLC